MIFMTISGQTLACNLSVMYNASVQDNLRIQLAWHNSNSTQKLFFFLKAYDAVLTILIALIYSDLTLLTFKCLTAPFFFVSVGLITNIPEFPFSCCVKFHLNT